MNQMLPMAFRAIGSFPYKAHKEKTSTRAIRPLTKADIPDIMKGQRTV